ncbi:MAG: 4Fe-4S dicluster domain-containing protein [Thermus sp.]|uniref:4Fe-4S dicluster domain-containing protein n=1 Tax=Thermus sp. TaxID=275 RepID=UPI0025D00FA4|nr:4Fe-4S dicluster domain-containing protein [Thermus sp.]MCS6867431.1 4Fe-4S dicluster domain-containing protein [Thermus sp.]MCS7217942.1 4Fe-4S dicluster domain-containing protein [Thermus sp.]MCX7850327.1 4Fe-4S dicluster domain-containing protein [Thermus sp.]MDW8016438.1 4Fe-4S dicluster domain-containing protein [Thermus sp.]MDW8357246.1 4Fe-4S dicluster domain-containing protein [Thermus sp.]
MPRYAMAIDLSLCVGCAACAVACKMENEVPPGVFNLWIRERELGSYPHPVVEFRPEQCLHCENPPCVPVCPTGASYQTKEGLVLVDPKKCIACGACIAACPYDARYLHPAGYVSKCTFCAHRLAQGKVPACVETCPTYCRTFGDLDDPESPVSQALRAAERVDVLRPEQGTRPKLFYLNAPSKKGLSRESEVRHD